jgi:hypothetical protein
MCSFASLQIRWRPSIEGVMRQTINARCDRPWLATEVKSVNTLPLYQSFWLSPEREHGKMEGLRLLEKETCLILQISSCANSVLRSRAGFSNFILFRLYEEMRITYELNQQVVLSRNNQIFIPLATNSCRIWNTKKWTFPSTSFWTEQPI